MKRVMLVALAALAAAAAACSDDDDSGTKAPDPVPGSGVTTPTPSSDDPPGTVPPLNLPPPAPPTPDGGATPEVPGPPNPVPETPAKRAIWAVDERHHLLRIIATDPSDVVDVTAMDLPAGEEVVGLDFRPSNGMLYALTTASKLYTVELVTAKTTAVGPETSPRVQGQSVGLDFNPVLDTIRVQTDVDQNLRLDPTTGAVVGSDATLAFTSSDPNYLQSPNVVGTSYTNSTKPAPAETMLFAVDSTRDLLLKVPSPDDGMIGTVGSLGIDIQAEGADFDIWGAGAGLEAYLVARTAGQTATNVYKVDLTSGAATLVGPVNHPYVLNAIAVRP